MTFVELVNSLPKTDLWQYIKSAGKPVILYGMGDGADKVIKVLDKIGVSVSDVFASDEYVRGHYFRDHLVLKYSDILSKYTDGIVLLCFAAKTEELFERFADIENNFEFYAPDTPVTGDGLFDIDYFKSHMDDFEFVFNLLADDRSREVFADVIRYKLSGKIKYLYSADSDKREAYTDILKQNGSENFMDLGAYTGDTVAEFTAFSNGKYNGIIAVEPDLRSYKKLVLYTENMQGTVTVNSGISDKDEIKLFSNKGGRMSAIGDIKGIPTQFRSVDSICEEYGFVPTFIKMDLEGGERDALSGAANTLEKHRPKLQISAYHKTDDLITLPKLLLEINKNYKLYLRKHKYVPAWDINIYAV